jgi:hypothetical protein
MEEELERHAYTLYPRHHELLVEIAVRHGDTGASGALRYILDEWAKMCEWQQRGEEFLADDGEQEQML